MPSALLFPANVCGYLDWLALLTPTTSHNEVVDPVRQVWLLSVATEGDKKTVATESDKITIMENVLILRYEA